MSAGAWTRLKFPLHLATVAPPADDRCMLRGDHPDRTRRLAVLLLLVIGGLAAALVAAGNPGHMGICGACFLRDLGGALGLHQGPAIVRPEVCGLALGALSWSLLARRHVGRSGSHAVARFLLCMAMAIGALVFLGCPFRLLQRLGGGDGNAWLALPGLVGGVGLAMRFEQHGYSLGKTQEVPRAVGLLGPLVFFGLLVAFAVGADFRGPGPGNTGGPAHAPWLVATGIGVAAGGVLSATGFCAISAVRSLFRGPRWMLWAALAFVLGYAAIAALTGGLVAGFAGQPIAHGDWLWNTPALLLVGLCGALAGGCPVRQIVMAGEGNGDAFVGCAGLVVGGAIAHSLQLASIPATQLAGGGATANGKLVVVGLLVSVLLYAVAMTKGTIARTTV